ncbi:MAG: response regulator [Gammaproteobacteria bacterium]
MAVDDSNVIRTMVEKVIADKGLEFVGSAKNGVEAISQFKEFRPQLVTMDLTMPLMDGIETTKSLLEIDPDVKILVVSALADKKTLLEAIKIGAAGYLCKPFTEHALLDALDELMEE